MMVKNSNNMHKAVDRLKENPLIAYPQLSPMYNYAKDKHDATGAKRKHSGDDYWMHPSGVADLAVAFGGDETEIQVAMAHDTLEDTSATYEELADQFGEDIAAYVQEITNDKDEVVALGKEGYINQELLSISHPALFVKLCDILYNCIDYPSEEQLERMARNVQYLVKKREDLDDRELDLIDEILTTYKMASKE